jgi:putative transposase
MVEKKHLSDTAEQLRRLIDPEDSRLSVRRQCELLGLPRSTLYYQPLPETAANLALMRRIDEQYLRAPFFGSRRMAAWLQRHGETVNRKRVQRLMRLMGLEVVYPRPCTTVPGKGHRVYPYLLRDVAVSRVDQVWSTDITYVPLARGFLYLTAVLDWHSRLVLSWRLSNSLEARFCIEALEEALTFGVPEIFNTDQGVQFTSGAYTARLEEAGVAISMDGRGRALDNVFVERLWRSVKTDPTKHACLHARCRGPYNRHHHRLSVGAARTGELVPRPAGFFRRTRTMSRPQPDAVPPRPGRLSRLRRSRIGRISRRAIARSCCASSAGC